jgi:uroporphyrinogen-III decarboxylase
MDRFHFTAPPEPATVEALVRSADRPFSPPIVANQGAVSYIARQTDLMPVGMLIGPFSLMTKLVSDPIAPLAMAAAGSTAAEDPAIATLERGLEMARATVLRSARAQIAAGAKALIVCEPAANMVFFSPRQLKRDGEIFERFVLTPNRELRDLLAAHDVDLIFHNCGELTTDMVRMFSDELRPHVMSLGSSRKLWEDAAVVADDIVLYGNLPTKTFYSDEAMPEEEVRRLSRELVHNMGACGHAHILGSECDVLHVPEAAETIRRKVAVMLEA